MKNYSTPTFELLQFGEDTICASLNKLSTDPWGFDFDWEETLL